MDIKTQAKQILQTLTLKEKILLQTGVDKWNTFDISQKGLPSISVSDGPHGLRKEVSAEPDKNMAESLPAVCFPTASKLGCSFDVELTKLVGQMLAQQCLMQNVAVLLAPGINIKRNTLCGRNFEYFSEDPFLAGEMGAAFVDGVQSQGVGVSLKHFAANSQEYARLVSDSVVDQRALREIYLSAFERVVKKSQPATIMCAYNKLNGEFCSENKWLLTDVLRNQWGFDGVVMSDWGAVNHRPAGIKAGLNLQMPCGDVFPVEEALKSGELTEQDLDNCILPIIELILKYKQLPQPTATHGDAHELAKRVSAECTVLAKNSCDILPFSKDYSLAVIGNFACQPHFQGGGSSKVNPTEVLSICDALKQQNIEFSFAQGYDQNGETNDQLLEQAIEAAKQAKNVLLVVGLTDIIEYEGFDRQDMQLPKGHLQLIDAVTNANSNVVAVLQCGAPVDMGWQNSVKAVLLDYLSGQAGGGAIADIIFGKTNPSGRVAETWVLDKNDQPSQSNFSNDDTKVLYKESIFVGYNFFDTANVQVCYPFGHGLSYTKFAYDKIKLSAAEISNDGSVDVSMDIKNVGNFDGSEVVQVYVRNLAIKDFHQDKSLKGFAKVHILKGKKASVKINLPNDSFAYFNTQQNKFVVDGGKYEIVVAENVSQPIATLPLTIRGECQSIHQYDELSAYYNVQKNKSLVVSDQEFENLLGKKIPNYQRGKKQPHTINSTFSQINDRFWGRLVNKIVEKSLKKMTQHNPELEKAYRESIACGPLRILTMQGLSLNYVYALLDFVNGKVFRAVFSFLREMNRTKKQKKLDGK